VRISGESAGDMILEQYLPPYQHWRQLTRVKDVDPLLSRAGVVYKVPCSCGKKYIGETKRGLGTS